MKTGDVDRRQPILDPPAAMDRVLGRFKTRSYRKVLRHEESQRLFRSLDNEIFQLSGGDSIALGIVSAQAREGRTTISLLLSVLSAAFDPQRQILLIDGHLGDAKASSLLGIARDAPGLYRYMNGSVDLDEVTHEVGLPNLDVVPGFLPEGAAPRLAHPRIALMIEEARRRYNLIVVDTPPARSGKDYASLAKIVRNVLVVVRYRRPYREQIRLLENELTRVGANIVGAILNRRVYAAPRLLYGIR